MSQLAPVILNYTNYRGELSKRTITPDRIWFGSTDFHPEPQWIISAFDHDKQAVRDFAFKDFGSPEQSPAPAKREYVDCACTKIQQDEHCLIGYPSLLCEICDGKGVMPYVKLDGPELWEIVFSIANEVAHEITDEQYTKIADAINSVFIDAKQPPRAQALEQAAQFAPAMVPAKMLLEAKSIQDLLFILGGCDEENPYHDGILWVGTMPDEDGDKYGLHVYSNEYPEEGSITLATFVPPTLPASTGASE